MKYLAIIGVIALGLWSMNLVGVAGILIACVVAGALWVKS